jgi:CDP-diacylglycerol--serine O-phosphatidyltransferase
MNWRQLLPTLMTVAAMLSGFLSILVIFEGMRTQEPGLYSWAARLIMLAMILDGLDGNLARWLKGETAFGGELDTYVDLTAFGIAPAILVFAVTLEHQQPLWRILLPSAVALSGVMRLARFKVIDPLRGQGGYTGLPITANAGWVALFVFISQVPAQNVSPEHDPFSLRQGWFAVLFLTGIISFIILQVTNVRYPKPTKKASLFFPCLGMVLLLIVLPKHLAVWVATVMLMLGLAYAVCGPLFSKGMQVHKARAAARSVRREGAKS